ncbi:hypothetical protein [Salisediminibacterium beveridgei]|uniref:hypothetical protein n=1 Tax=Salisediminibacterium beveridgei TaxID=632773 RepID=UPI0018DB5680|nr:hypothetical protein [Salisediminibacterium beveridgei]
MKQNLNLIVSLLVYVMIIGGLSDSFYELGSASGLDNGDFPILGVTLTLGNFFLFGLLLVWVAGVFIVLLIYG